MLKKEMDAESVIVQRAKPKVVILFSIITGLLAFLIFVGPRALQTSNIAWLAKGDPSTHYLGWVFFRDTPWMFPLGLNPNYGLEIGNAIIFSDSNPLLAILFKSISYFIPKTFQYLGIWLLSCFILQAFFSFKLIDLLKKNNITTMLGAILFVIAPPMLWRLHGHFNLVAHFFIVAALYLALASPIKHRTTKWALLITACALVHAYLLAMVGAIWASDLTSRLLSKQRKIRSNILELIIIISCTALSCWQAGYFSVGDGVSTAGFGYLRMNLLSILDPSGWSYVIKDIPEGSGDYEGFNYLGLGVFFLIIAAIPAFLKNARAIMLTVLRKPTILILAILLIVFALSNNIGIGANTYSLPLPTSLYKLANVFRASGRMFWPVYYLIIFFVLYIVTHGYSKTVCSTLLAMSIAIQLLDTSNAWRAIRQPLMITPSSSWNTELKDPIWAALASNYSTVRAIEPGYSDHWQTIASYAASNHLATNAAYLGRVSREQLESAQLEMKHKIQSGRLDSNTLYIIDEKHQLQAALRINQETDLLAKIDNFIVIAPGWKSCATCRQYKNEIQESAIMPTSLKQHSHLLFSKGESGEKYLAGGWMEQEQWGTWSDGEESSLVLPLARGDVTSILFEANPLLAPSVPTQRVNITINGMATETVLLRSDYSGKFKVLIPTDLQEKVKSNSVVLRIDLNFPDAVRPADIGISGDVRKLALGLISITIQ